MASQRMLIAIAIVALAISPVLAKEYIVGDDKGWTMNDPDYEAWAAGKNFQVGDKLVFKYKKGFHNVIKVDEASFKSCVEPANSEALTSGEDVVTLEKPGKEWFICGVGSHCDMKQKLAITVLPQGGSSAASTSPASAPSANESPANATTASESPASASPASAPSGADSSVSVVNNKSTATGITAPKFYVCIAAAFGYLMQIVV